MENKITTKDIKNLENGISGIYRIYLKKDGFEYSYVGVSKDIKKRLNEHLTDIRGYLLDKETKDRDQLTRLLKLKVVPSKKASQFKIALFIIENNLNINDLNFEILEECNWEEIEMIEDREIEFIEKFDSEWRGFNGVHAKYFKWESKYSFTKRTLFKTGCFINYLIDNNQDVTLNEKYQSILDEINEEKEKAIVTFWNNEVKEKKWKIKSSLDIYERLSGRKKVAILELYPNLNSGNIFKQKYDFMISSDEKVLEILKDEDTRTKYQEWKENYDLLKQQIENIKTSLQTERDRIERLIQRKTSKEKSKPLPWLNFNFEDDDRFSISDWNGYCEEVKNHYQEYKKSTSFLENINDKKFLLETIKKQWPLFSVPQKWTLDKIREFYHLNINNLTKK